MAGKLIKVTHRFVQQDTGGRGPLGGGGVKVVTNEVWIHPDHIVAIVSEGDWYSLRTTLNYQVTIDAADLGRVLASADT